MNVTCTIGGVDRTNWVKVNTARWNRSINSRGTASLEIEDIGRGWTPLSGQSISLVVDGTTVFAGNIGTVKAKRHPGLRGYLWFSLEAQDYNHIADRRVVAATYENQSVHDIVDAVVANFLTGEGVTTTNVYSASPALVITSKLEFNYETVTQVLNKLASIAGYTWWIDVAKDLHFGPLLASVAPISISDNSDNFRELVVEYSRDEYRNRQYVRTEYDLGRNLSDTFVGDGSTRFFVTRLPISKKPTVKVNGVAKTVGQLGVDGPGWDWYWLLDGFGVQNFAPNPILTSADTLVVDYTAGFSNVVVAEDKAEQAAWATRTGNSGIIESVEEQRNISDWNTLDSIGTARLRQYGKDVTRLEFICYVSNIAPGQYLPVNITYHGLNGNYTIEKVDYSWVAGKPDIIEATVGCTSQEPFRQPAGFLERVVEQSRIGPTPKIQQQTLASAGVDRFLARLIYPDTAAVGNDVIDNWRSTEEIESPRRVELDTWIWTAKDDPRGSPMLATVDVSTDKGATWTNMFTASLTANSHQDTSPISPIAILRYRNLVRMNLTQVGSTSPGGRFELVLVGDIVDDTSPLSPVG